MHRPACAFVVAAFVVLSCAPSRPKPLHVPKPTCPPDMALVSPSSEGNALASFCVDRFEGSLVEISADGEKPFSPYEHVEGRRVRAVSQQGAVPQGYISQVEAMAACGASHKRLCKEDEWNAACRGARRTPFPYGVERKRGYCNDEGRSPLMHYYASRGKHAFDPEPMNDPRLNQLSGTVSATGAHPHCMSDYGVYDMVGNLHEWIDDPNGTFRGGYYLDTKINGQGCDYKTTAHGVGYHDYSTGFRCCKDADMK